MSLNQGIHSERELLIFKQFIWYNKFIKKNTLFILFFYTVTTHMNTFKKDMQKKLSEAYFIETNTFWNFPV